MAMTKKDYALIAQALKEAFPAENASFPIAYAQHRTTVLKIVHALMEDNPRFNAVKFGDAIYGIM